MSGSPPHPPPPTGVARSSPSAVSPPEKTFSDSSYHSDNRTSRQQQQQQRQYDAHDAQQREKGPRRGEKKKDGGKGNRAGAASTARGRPRWSWVAQDVPSNVHRALHDVNKGYAARVVALIGVAGGVGLTLYYGLFVPWQERRPLAQRWTLLTPSVPITLLEKRREEGSAMTVFRFALPNSYDYAGYDPVSSVQVHSGAVRGLTSVKRWYTPISLPHERGIIEFAIKDCDPGRMSARLRAMGTGDVAALGRWMREFPYTKNTYKEMGLICTTSGASVALQLMNVMNADPADRTRLRFLYCHRTATAIPFREEFERLAKRSNGRIRVAYNVLTTGKSPLEEGLELHRNLFVGHIGPSTFKACLPPPVRTVTVRPTPPSVSSAAKSSEEPSPTVSEAAGVVTTFRPPILVCAPQSMLTYMCGRVSPVFQLTYWQGLPLRYGGFMKDLGYERSQVYKFGVSTHWLVNQ